MDDFWHTGRNYKQKHQNTPGSHTACNSYSSLQGFPYNVLFTQHGHHRDLKEDGVGGGGAQFSDSFLVSYLLG